MQRNEEGGSEMEEPGQFIIYGMGKQGKTYYDFIKEKGLDGRVEGFCDRRYSELGEYDGKRCYGYDEAKLAAVPFLISPWDRNVFLEIQEQIKKDGGTSYEMNNIADYLGVDKVEFNRDFIAFYHIENMDNYFEDAEDYGHMSVFWGEKGGIYPLFCKLDLTNVIELACGRGRHVGQYIDQAGNVTLVDILEKNIDICKNRYKTYNKIHFYCNNGFNLEQLPSDRYTALFSYDAMVHFEMLDIYEYLKDIYRVLVKGGRVLIHHSNYDKDYTASFINSLHGRSYMNASIFAYLATRCGFHILEQKLINWAEVEGLDCVTLLEK